ncbi:MAG TPA: hypothetical protein ENK91_02875 [Bacteroidetes bacterium]|nr:hypothetical protein [Bacteroidota bacterium]
MTEKNLEKLIDEMPSIAAIELAKGYPVSYESDKYPGLLLKEYPNGRLESVSANLETGEIIVLEVLRKAHEK